MPVGVFFEKFPDDIASIDLPTSLANQAIDEHTTDTPAPLRLHWPGMSAANNLVEDNFRA